MSVTLESLLANSERLGSFPAIVHRINDAVEDPRFSLDEVGQIVQEDPVLSARLLRIANSSFYSQRFPIDTIARALAVIGTKQLKELVTATYVMNTFSAQFHNDLDTKSFWKHCIACGVACRALATARREANVERFYLMGLLHDLGKVLLFTELGDQSAKMLKNHQQNGIPLYQMERDQLGFDHADLGGRLLERWKLPMEIHQPVSYHHKPAEDAECPLESAILHLADIISIGLRPGSGGQALIPPLNNDAWQVLHLPTSILPELFNIIRLQYFDAVAIFLDDHAADG
ncbi:MAG: HDOD domain-containing protein [Magnetococcales bacterium]|nr:HDOD domain-containing protein [Magnetococcales bacterium]